MKTPFELRDYQKSISDEAAQMLWWLKICYLTMEVRTGKTLTALATAEKYKATKVLFVTKKKAIQSIKDDYTLLSPSFGIKIVNYEQLHNYSDWHDLVIIDEAHSLGQYPKPAQRVKLLKMLCRDKPIIFLSGTPTPESYSQLYHQFYISSFSPFKEYKNFYKWAEDFVWVTKKYINRLPINDYGNANKKKIDDNTKHLFLTYTQAEAGFEQMVNEKIIKVRMKPVTYNVADRLKNNRIVTSKTGEEVLGDTEVKLMQKLHQIYSGTVKTENGGAMCFDNSKADFIYHHFKDKRVAVFYKFIAEGNMLRAVFGDKVTDSPEEFNCSDDKVFISQIQSGREGISLATADCLVMMNIDFSSVSYQQARARIQSKERVKEAMLYWIFSEGGIEEKIYKAVQDKQDYTLSWFLKDFDVKEKKNVG